MKLLGIVLAVLGVVALLYGGIGYNRQRTVLQMGSMTASVTEHKTLPIAPIAGVIALIGGVALYAAGVKQRS
jgi:drug/metabolite transporter (DMT)-like permease